MPITRQAAILRLISFWCDRVAKDEYYAIRVTLSDLLQPDVIDRVWSGDFLAEYDLDVRIDRIVELEREAQRGQEMIRAWTAPRSGRAQ